jgi:hypothetical protein
VNEATVAEHPPPLVPEALIKVDVPAPDPVGGEGRPVGADPGFAAGR